GGWDNFYSERIRQRCNGDPTQGPAHRTWRFRCRWRGRRHRKGHKAHHARARKPEPSPIKRGKSGSTPTAGAADEFVTGGDLQFKVSGDFAPTFVSDNIVT